MNTNSIIISNYQHVTECIKNAHKKYGLGEAQSCPKLIAVTKTHSIEKIIPLLEHGHRIYGENKVQETIHKWPELREKFDNIELHLIGHLQTNKAKDALENFEVIQSLDREKLAREFNKLIENSDPKETRTRELFIQVNTGGEEQKSGIVVSEADDFINYCISETKLNITGLMCIPPADEEPAMHFALLRKIAERNKLRHLSMGMSGDYETATAMGATYTRVGSAIFGERSPA